MSVTKTGSALALSAMTILNGCSVGMNISHSGQAEVAIVDTLTSVYPQQDMKGSHITGDLESHANENDAREYKIALAKTPMLAHQVYSKELKIEKSVSPEHPKKSSGILIDVLI